MNLVVVTPPPVEPVSLADVWDHLRLTPDNDSPPAHPHDAMLRRHIAAARGDAERTTKRAFVRQTLRLYGSGFPYGAGAQYFGGRRRSGAVELLRPPLISVSSVGYYDADGVARTVDSANYFTTSDLVPQLRFVDGYSAPDVYDRPDAFYVEYVVGYPTVGSPIADYTANIPAEIKSAILIGVELLYNPLKPAERLALERARDALLVGFTVTTL